jgi:hypothetical protein
MEHSKPPQYTNNETLQNDMSTATLERPNIDTEPSAEFDIPEFENQKADKLEEDFEKLAHDEDMRQLADEIATFRGIELGDERFDSEESAMDFMQQAFDFRNGAGRNAVKAIDLGEQAKAALDVIIDKYDMKRDTEPTFQEVDMVFIPGAAGAVPAKRLSYAMELIEAGKLKSNVITMIGCERPIDMKPNTAGTTEIDRAGPAGHNSHGEPAKTESDLMRNTIAVQFGIADEEWETWEGTDPRVPKDLGFQENWKIYHCEKDGMHLFVLSAPMLGDARYQPDGSARTRSNTSDGYIMAAEMMRDHNPNEPIRTVTITDSIYQFQAPDAEGALAPYGVEADFAGYNRQHHNQPEWPAGDAMYIQEILSLLRQTRAARDYLARRKAEKQAA